jgi:hypothetical protein
VTIANHRAIFAPLMDRLPPTWTVLYKLTRLKEGQLERLNALGAIRRDLTSRDIDLFLLLDRDAGNGNQPMPEGETYTEAFCPFATILISAHLPAEAKEALKERLQSSLVDQAAHIEFVEEKGAAQKGRREQLIPSLRAALAACLAPYCEARNNLTPEEYETYENTGWQHQHKNQKGTYPYAPSDPRSIEHEDHQFWIGGKFADHKAFFRHLGTEKIIMSYSPLTAYADLGEARCIRYALDYCEALSAKPRSVSKARLEVVIEKEPANAAHAKKYLQMITDRAAGA